MHQGIVPVALANGVDPGIVRVQTLVVVERFESEVPEPRQNRENHEQTVERDFRRQAPGFRDNLRLLKAIELRLL